VEALGAAMTEPTVTDREWIESLRKSGAVVPVFYTQKAWERVRAIQREAMAQDKPCPSLESLWQEGDVDREKTLKEQM
jgi:hypothetical protein